MQSVYVRLRLSSSLVRAYHDNTVLTQQGIDERLTEQHSIRHILDTRPILAAQIFEANCIPDLIFNTSQRTFKR